MTAQAVNDVEGYSTSLGYSGSYWDYVQEIASERNAIKLLILSWFLGYCYNPVSFLYYTQAHTEIEEVDGIAAGQRRFAGMADVFGEDGDV